MGTGLLLCWIGELDEIAGPRARGEQFPVVGELGSKLERHGEHQLSKRHAWQDVIHQVGCALARGRDVPALARKDDEFLFSGTRASRLRAGTPSPRNDRQLGEGDFVQLRNPAAYEPLRRAPAERNLRSAQVLDERGLPATKKAIVFD